MMWPARQAPTRGSACGGPYARRGPGFLTGWAALVSWGMACVGMATLGTASASPSAAPGAGDVVATITLEAPEHEVFLLRATLPVPPGTWPPGSEGSPLTVLDQDGSAVTTQAEVVSRYADPLAGADVLELIARVHRGVGNLGGDRLHYEVTLAPQAPGVFELHPDVIALLETPRALEVSSWDVFDHLYRAPLAEALAEAPSTSLTRDGALVREWALHMPMLPDTPVQGDQGTLPHMLGVHAYLRAVDNRPYVLLDLHLHNGFDGLDKQSPEDDALVGMYFKHLNLRVPQGWKVLHAFDNPAIGGDWPSPPYVDHLLLRQQKWGKHYHVPKQGHFVFRLAVAREGFEARARAELKEAHLGFARRGRNASGDPLWSWWNSDTARYFPQRHRLPSLDHVGLDNLRADLTGKFELREQQVAQGSSGIYPMNVMRLGWAHTWGVPYGGMTGGDEIFVFDGVRTAASWSRDGYRLAQLVMGAYMDRQPTALYSRSGRPTNVKDVLFEGPGGPYVTTTFFLVPKTGDPFGFDDAPTFQNEAALAKGLVPWWQKWLETYYPIDLQHYVRYTRNLKTLAWLGNDSLAKAELEAAAEIFHLSFHQYSYDTYGYVEANSLLSRMIRVAEDPGEGVQVGRAEAWGLDAVAAAYSVGSDSFRERTRDWLKIVARTLVQGQSNCTGNLMAIEVGKLLDGRYLLRRSNESGYLENAIRGLIESVFRGQDDDIAWDLERLLVRSVLAGVMHPFWSDKPAGSHWTVGVSRLDHMTSEFCFDVPSDAIEGGVDNSHSWSSLTYAWEASPQALFLERAESMLGGGLWFELHDQGIDFIESRAALLALVQSLRVGVAK